MGWPAVFIDKDGTLVKDIPPNIDPAAMRLSEEAEAGLRAFKKFGFLLIVISNQDGVAMGRFSEQALSPIAGRLRQLVARCGSSLDGFYYCPHHPLGSVEQYAVACECRKPSPGLVLQAAVDHDVDLSLSWFIGDILNDVEAGRRAGCTTILIDNGNETEWDLSSEFRRPHFVAPTIDAAADIVCSQSARRAA